MNRTYRDLFKHSAIYGIGQILSRVASLLLLPVYTHYLTPADYGIIGILDLTLAIVGTLIGAGVGQAVSRFHFSAADEHDRDAVWWTGLTILAVMSIGFAAAAWSVRNWLAALTLGPSSPNGGTLYSLALPTLVFGSTGVLLDAYVRIQKWSVVYAGISLARLLINIGLNVALLVFLDAGVAGILAGNLITGILTTGVLFFLFARSRGAYRVDPALSRNLFAFGLPLVLTSLLSLGMHQADRYFLRAYVTMHDVGVYSLAYQMGQGLNSLILMPFVAIWSVLKLEIAGNPESRRTYADVFKHFTCGLLLIMFATSICGRLVVGLLAAPEFLPAADLLPFICFGYVFFSASDFFAIPAIVHSRTGYALPAALSGFAVTVLGNLVLVPWIGTYGAALTTIVTFAVHASVNLFVCRRLERIHFPLGAPLTLALVLAGGYMAFRAVLGSTLPAWIAYSGGLLLATASTHVCFGGVIWRRIRPPRETSTAPAPSAMGEPVI